MSTGVLQHISSNNGTHMDKYLTQQPEISFFKYSFKKYSNFSIEAIELNFNDRLVFGQESNIIILRHGDLINRMYLKLSIKAKCSTKRWGLCKNFGINLIDYVEIFLGEQKIDTLYGEWLNIWYNLSLNSNLKSGYDEMIGNNNIYTNIYKDENDRDIDLFIPIDFFFNKNIGLALPLISLQRMEVIIKVKLKNFEDCINSDKDFTINDWDTVPVINGTLLVDYIFLDSKERNIFIQSNNELLIEQHNKIPYINLNSNTQFYNEYIELYNVTKSIYWTITMNKYIDTQKIKKNIFLENNLIDASKRFLLMSLCSCLTKTTKISQNITAGSNFKIGTNYTIEFYDKTGVNYNVGCLTKLNNTYINYNNIKELIENCIINKDIIINSATIDNVDLSFITIFKYLDYHTYSLTISEIEETSNTNIYRPFEKFIRSEVSGGIGISSYDLRLFNYNNYGLYLDNQNDTLLKLKIRFDGSDRTENNEGEFYNLIQTYNYHSNIPDKGIYMFSFSLNPEQYQPTGTANFSIINNIELVFSVNEIINNNNFAIMNLYSVNYNILRITSGIAGLQFSR